VKRASSVEDALTFTLERAGNARDLTSAPLKNSPEGWTPTRWQTVTVVPCNQVIPEVTVVRFVTVVPST